MVEDYKQKYLKYKQKYLELRSKLQLGGAILPWFPVQSCQLYIEAVIDPVSHLGREITQRLGRLHIAPSEFHITLLEILVPTDLRNYGAQRNDNPIHQFLANQGTIDGLARAVRDIYARTLSNAIAYSAQDNYAMFGRFFVRKYDDPIYVQYFSAQFRDFKIGIINELLVNSTLRTNFDSIIRKPLIKHRSSSDPSRPPVITKEFTHYYNKRVLPHPTPVVLPPKKNDVTSLFAISQHFNTPSSGAVAGAAAAPVNNGWVPHISITNQQIPPLSFRGVTSGAAISLLPLWSSRETKPRPDNQASRIQGSISELVIKYSGNIGGSYQVIEARIRL